MTAPLSTNELSSGTNSATVLSQLASNRLAMVLVVLIALFSRAALIKLMPIGTEQAVQQRVGDEKYYLQIANAILDKGHFVEGNLLAYRPPLYPAFVATTLLAFGRRLAALQVLQNLMFVGASLLLGFLAWRRSGKAGGVICGAMVLFSPLWLALPQTAYSETLFLSLIAVQLVLLDHLDRGKGEYRFAALLGLSMGAAALTREIALPAAALTLVAYIFVGTRNQTRLHRFKVSLLAGALMICAVGVWTARNYSVFGHLVPISTNGAINFYLGNNPEATGDMHWALPKDAQAIWNTPSENGRDELEADRLSFKGALANIHDAPGRTLEQAGKKWFRFWFTPPTDISGSLLSIGGLVRVGRTGFELALTALGLWGLWLLRREAIAWAIFLGMAFASLTHAVTFFNLRFRAPFDALLALPAAVAVATLSRRWTARRNRTARPLVLADTSAVRR